MTDVVLGDLTCPAGQLVLLDGGYLDLWSGERSPDEIMDEDSVPAIDFEIVGTDDGAAARSFDRQSGRRLYDIPRHAVEEFAAGFDRHCRDHGLEAALRPFPRRVPHRERVRHAIAAGDDNFIITGVPVIVLGDVPKTATVTATPCEWGWARMRITFSAEPVAASRQLGVILVDWARFVFADADALDSWEHELSLDGLADIVFWGRDGEQLAAELDAPRTGLAGEDNFGWIDQPIREAVRRAIALEERKAAGDLGFAFDFRPHSHHWQVMAGVRAAEHQAATITVGGAEVMMAMTSIGDGGFPVHLHVDAAGRPVAADIVIEAADDVE